MVRNYAKTHPCMNQNRKDGPLETKNYETNRQDTAPNLLGERGFQGRPTLRNSSLKRAL